MDPWVALSTQLILSIAFYLFPVFSPPSFFFAITVTPDFRNTPEARSILLRYRIRICILSAVGLLLTLSLAWFFRMPHPFGILLPIASHLALLFWVQADAHRQTRSYQVDR